MPLRNVVGAVEVVPQRRRSAASSFSRCASPCVNRNPAGFDVDNRSSTATTRTPIALPGNERGDPGGLLFGEPSSRTGKPTTIVEPVVFGREPRGLCGDAFDAMPQPRDVDRLQRPRARPRRVANRETDATLSDVDAQRAHDVIIASFPRTLP